MAEKLLQSRASRHARHRRVRAKVIGVTSRPRLSVFRSLNHIYAQIVDDSQGRTLVQASTVDPDLKGKEAAKGKKALAELVGMTVAQRAKAAGIEKVVFDRGGYQYQGRVQALAEAARKGGLVF
jgi:large subunit ribosomal protein L18